MISKKNKGKAVSFCKTLGKLVCALLLCLWITYAVVDMFVGLDWHDAAFDKFEEIRFKKELSKRKLILPSEAEYGFSPDALVLLVRFHFATNEASVSWGGGSGFSVGDGTLVVTAAHCVRKGDPNQPTYTSEAFVLSPYYGDIFPIEILAVDQKTDIALIKPCWPGHPALQLGTEQDLPQAQALFVATRSLSERDFFQTPQAKESGGIFSRPLSGQARMERIPVTTVNGPVQSEAIVLASTRFVTNGWSGSPLLHTENTQVLGIVNAVNSKSKHDRTMVREVLGSDLSSIHHLLDQCDQNGRARKQPGPLPVISDAEQAYTLAQSCLVALSDKDQDKAFSAASHLVELRNESPMAHFLLGVTSYLKYAHHQTDHPLVSLAKQSFEKAQSLSHNDALLCAVHANFLRLLGRQEEALVQVDKAISQDPNQELALYNRLRLLAQSDPNEADKAARTLLQLNPKKTCYWFDYSIFLHINRKHKQALRAAREGVRLDPNGRAGQQLTKMLANLGRLNEAELERTYRQMLDKDSRQVRYWYWFCEYLAEYFPGEPEKAHKAIRNTSTKDSRELDAKR